MSDQITPIPTPMHGKSSIYAHPDPLLRRLRLEDPYGRPIETLKKDFMGKEVLVFFIGSMHGNENLKELNLDLINLARKYPKTCSVIYVSVDTTQKAVEAVANNKPFLRMSLLDSSDFAAMETEDNSDPRRRVEMEEVLRDEVFITGEEFGAGGIQLPFGKEEDETDYVRPLSRAAVAHLTNSYGTPALAVYHIPTHRFISKNTRRSQFRPDRIGENYRQWTAGSKKTRFSDIWDIAKIPIAVSVGGLIYQAFRTFGGEEWNVLPRIFSNLDLVSSKDVPSFSLVDWTPSLFSLPTSSTGGILPYWLAFVSVLSIFNTCQTFVSLDLSKRIYGKKPEQVTGISTRTFGVWTLLAAAIRMYTAYDVHNRALYNLSLISYVIAGGHFLSELFLFKTASYGPGALSPVVVASSSLIWMVVQKGRYLGSS